MKTLVFGGSIRPVRDKRPVLCSDCGEIIVAGTGEPTYSVSDNCRRLRGIAAMKLRRDLNHAMDPNSTYRRRAK